MNRIPPVPAWEVSPQRLAEDDLAFLDFYSWLLLPPEGANPDEPLSEPLARRLYTAVARVDRFRFRRLAVADLQLFEEGLFTWFKSFEGESSDLVDSLARSRGWPAEAARRFLFEAKPPFVRSGAEVPAKVERYYGLAGVEFIHGHGEASIALCRAALEGIFKARAGHRGGASFSLGEAIDRLFRSGKLTGPCLRYASVINDEANRVLHKLGEAREGVPARVFDSLRGFIEEWYGNPKRRAGARVRT